MRALNHLKKRFEFALLANKPLYLNQNDIDALNDIIEVINGKSKNEHLEDSLLLFYILQHWRVENIENKKIMMREDKQGVFQLTGADLLLKKLSMLIRPKRNVVEEIRDELRIHQAMNKIEPKNRIKTSDVEMLLDEVLTLAKNDFPIIKDLDKKEIVYVY